MAKNFCALPFHHTMLRTDGEYSVCCYHRAPKDQSLNIKTADYEQWESSDYLKQVRETFMRDERHPGCHVCWRHESQNIPSQRQRVDREYKILGVDVDKSDLTNIEIDLGNLCNLKCLMCDEYNSSAILAENRKLGINILSQQDMDWGDAAFARLKTILERQPKVVNIRGGEPFYNKKLLKLVQEIPDDHARAMCLHITTNATIWSDAWQQALSRFRLVRMMFSIDATDDLYEYIRYGASWSEVSRNVLTIAREPNVKPMIHCVVQNLNINGLGNLIEWSISNNIYLELDSIIDPKFLQIQNLPVDLKSQTMLQLQQWLERDYPGHIKEFLSRCYDVLAKSSNDPELWAQFQQQIGMRDELRGNTYTRFLKGK